jgi:hypothetical protein
MRESSCGEMRVSVPVVLDEIYCTILYYNLSYAFSILTTF